jgi:diaminopimelate decarboxylase
MERGSRQEVVPSSHFRREGGELTCDGVPLRALGEQFGTPLHVFSEAALLSSLSSVRAALAEGAKGRAHEICYAMKANGAPSILRRLALHGAGCDVVSGGELYWALRAGFGPERIVMSGVGKTDEDLRAALAAGVSIHVESEPELDVIEELARAMGRPAHLGLRINPNVDAGTHPYIATGLFDTKFGLSMEVARRIARRLQSSERLHLHTLSSHIGSQIGGWPVSYGDEDEAFPPFSELGQAIGRGLLRAKAPADMALVVEPGRALVGDAGVVLSRVLFEKVQESHTSGAAKRFVIVDAAMTELIRPSLYGAYHAVEPVGPSRGASTKADLVGPVCETGDFFASDRWLPPMLRGDLLVLRTTGAYGSTMASEYNARPRAAEVMVCTDRTTEVMRPRGRVEALHVEAP